MAVSSRPVPFFTIDSPLNEGVEALGNSGAPIEHLYRSAPSIDATTHEIAGLDNVHVRMAVVLAGVAIVGLLFFQLLVRNVRVGESAVAVPGDVDDSSPAESARQMTTTGGASGVLSPLFTREVLHWEPQIVVWSEQHGVDPNVAAIIMQIESCGDPGAVSSAGAQGLFQVMPFHFASGENPQDPDTNAARGLKYFADRLVQTSGDIGRAFAGYNGGHVAAGSSWDSWASETQRYYLWSTGIYGDIMSGGGSSPTLERWLAAGGAGLCQQAAARLGI